MRLTPGVVGSLKVNTVKEVDSLRLRDFFEEAIC